MAVHAFEGRGFARLPTTLRVAYAAGSLLDCIVTQGLNIFLLFYLTTVCGLPGGLAGAAISVGLVVDAVADPLIGSLSDSWHSKLGRRLPFMLVGAPAATLLFVVIFSLPSDWSTSTLFVWVATVSVLLRVAVSLFILPHQAVGAEVSDDTVERSMIVALRVGIGMVGILVALALGFGVFFSGPQGLSQRANYTPFVATLAAIGFAGACVSCWATAATRNRQHIAASKSGPRLFNFGPELLEVMRNRSFRVLFVGALTFFMAMGTNLSLGLHANTYFWHLSTAQTKVTTLSIFAGLVIGAPLAGPMLARMEKRTVLLIGLVGMAASQGGPAALRLCGWLDLEGVRLVVVLAGVLLMGNLLLSAAFIAFGSMMADAADEHELLFGARREGLYFAGWAFANKAAVGAGTLLAGLVLQAISFPTDVAASGVARLPDHMATLLGACFGPGCALLTLCSAGITLLYRIDRQAHSDILRMLAIRRKGALHDPGPVPRTVRAPAAQASSGSIPERAP